MAMGSLWRWLQKPEPDPKLLSPWPVARLLGWVERVNMPFSEPELNAVRLAANRGRPFGDQQWVQSTVKQFNLQSTIRPRGRQRIHPKPKQQVKEA